MNRKHMACSAVGVVDRCGQQNALFVMFVGRDKLDFEANPQKYQTLIISVHTCTCILIRGMQFSYLNCCSPPPPNCTAVGPHRCYLIQTKQVGAGDSSERDACRRANRVTWYMYLYNSGYTTGWECDCIINY